MLEEAARNTFSAQEQVAAAAWKAGKSDVDTTVKHQSLFKDMELKTCCKLCKQQHVGFIPRYRLGH